MIGTEHVCGVRRKAPILKTGRWRYARDVTEHEENEANRYAPAAILECDRCGARAVLEGSNKHPRAAAERVPDQSVFE
jgi:hypothetical protein